MNRQCYIVLLLTVGLVLSAFGVTLGQTELNVVTWYQPGALDSLVEAFEAENPDIKVVVTPVPGVRESFESILVRAAAGVPPDLAMVQHGEHALLMSNDIFLDLSPFIDREVDIEAYLPEMVRYWNKNHHVGGVGQVAFPLVAYTSVLYYNDDLFQQAGLVSPITLHEEGTWSRDAFEEAAYKTTRHRSDGTVETIGFTMIPDWIEGIIIHNAGGRYYNEDATRALITQAEFVDAVQWLSDLVHVREVAFIDEWDHKWFANGRAGMMLNAAWLMDMLVETDTNYDLVPMFYTGAHRPHHSPSGDAIAITKDSPNRDAALKFLQFMISPQGLRHFGEGVPIHREVASQFGAGSDHNINAFVYEIVEKTQTFYPPGIPGEISSILWGATNRVYTGEASARAALEEVVGSVNRILQDWHDQANE